MASSGDLIEHFRLTADILPNYTKHTFYKSDRARGQRKVTVEEIWRRQKTIGRGSHGLIWLEVKEQGKWEVESERAVKEVRKSGRLSASVSYYQKEILAMATLSKVRDNI